MMTLRWVLLLGFLATVSVADNEPIPREPARTLKVHPLAFAESAVVLDLATAIVGPGGKVTHDMTHNRLVVIGTAEQQAEIAKLIKELSVPPKNIQIQVRITDLTGESDSTVGVTGVQVTTGRVRGTGALWQETTQRSRHSTQMLTVSSGRRGWINVAQEVPYVDWFLEYGVRHAYLRADIRWRNIGSRLIVEPRVVGDGRQVHVQLIPELSYLVDNQLQSTAFVNAATEVTVMSGQEINLGGLTGQNEFYTKFLLGYDRARQQRVVDIILQPTILP